MKGFYNDTLKDPKKYKVKMTSLFIIIIGQISNFYFLTRIIIFRYGVFTRLTIAIGSIIFLIIYQKEYFKNSTKRKDKKYFIIVFSSLVWFFLYFFSFLGFYKGIILNSYKEKECSSKVIINKKYIGTNHKTTYNLITSNNIIIKTTENKYKNIKIGDSLDFYFFSKKDIYYYKKKNPQLPHE